MFARSTVMFARRAVGQAVARVAQVGRQAPVWGARGMASDASQDGGDGDATTAFRAHYAGLDDHQRVHVFMQNYYSEDSQSEFVVPALIEAAEKEMLTPGIQAWTSTVVEHGRPIDVQMWFAKLLESPVFQGGEGDGGRVASDFLFRVCHQAHTPQTLNLLDQFEAHANQTAKALEEAGDATAEQQLADTKGFAEYLATVRATPYVPYGKWELPVHALDDFRSEVQWDEDPKTAAPSKYDMSHPMMFLKESLWLSGQDKLEQPEDAPIKLSHEDAFHMYAAAAGGAVLDLWWYAFFASGDHQYLSKISEASALFNRYLHFSPEVIANPQFIPEDMQGKMGPITTEYVTGRAAFVPLVGHSRHHPAVRAFLSDHVQKVDGTAEGDVLKKVLAASQ